MAPTNTITEPSCTEEADLPTSRARDAWRGYLANIPPAVALPFDRPPQTAPCLDRGRCPVRVSDTVNVSLRTLASQEDVSPEIPWLAVLVAFLYRYTHEHALLIGVPASESLASEVNLWLAHVRGDRSSRELVSHLRDVAAEVAALGPISVSALGELR